MSQVPNIDLHIIAEQVASAVNRRLAELLSRIENLERRVTKLELDVETLRRQTIESVVRSMMSVRLEDVASLVTSKILENFQKTVSENVNALSILKSRVETVIEELKNIPDTVRGMIEEKLSKVQVQAQDTLRDKVLELLEKFDRLSKELSDVRHGLSQVCEVLRGLGEAKAQIPVQVPGLQQKIDSMYNIIMQVKDTVDNILYRLDTLTGESEASVEEIEEEGGRGRRRRRSEG